MQMLASTGLGLMSGTSLDGLDLALCTFGESHQAHIEAFTTINYPQHWRQRLGGAHGLSANGYMALECEYSVYTAQLVQQFLQDCPVKPQFIAAHGHTVFHTPQAGITTQLLNGALLAAGCGVPVVCDFRRTDVACGGQGAPLVPLGDKLLFPQYQACVNLGGFANISGDVAGKRIAWDIGPVNIVLNALAETLGHPYDPEGSLARQGSTIPNLLQALNDKAFYHQNPPKSLGREWVEAEVWPLIQGHNRATTQDLLRTFAEHAAMQIAMALTIIAPNGNALFTGGGVHNAFLMQRIQELTANSWACTRPPHPWTDAKEAVVFALLGRLRLLGEINTLASVTGANRNTCSGAVYLP
jgi:anhydro-N-acetylmuramic acid kinase